MARDKSYDLMYNLEDSGFQGFGAPDSSSFMENLLAQNANILESDKLGLLNFILETFSSPLKDSEESKDKDILKSTPKKSLNDFNLRDSSNISIDKPNTLKVDIPRIDIPEISPDDSPYFSEEDTNWPEEYNEDVDNFWKQLLQTRPMGAGTGSRGNVRR